MPRERMLFDPAAAANALADEFYSASRAVDSLRLDSDPPLPDADDRHLREQSDALEARAQLFTAQAIGTTLAGIQSDLGRIETATRDAAAQLAHLQTLDRAIQLATALLGLGVAISAGDPAPILTATQALLELL